MEEQKTDWDQLKEDLNDPVYVEHFVTAATQIATGEIFDKINKNL
jgi:hypothetical protein